MSFLIKDDELLKTTKYGIKPAMNHYAIKNARKLKS